MTGAVLGTTIYLSPFASETAVAMYAPGGLNILGNIMSPETLTKLGSIGCYLVTGVNALFTSANSQEGISGQNWLKGKIIPEEYYEDLSDLTAGYTAIVALYGLMNPKLWSEPKATAGDITQKASGAEFKEGQGKKTLNYKASSGAILETDPKRTTTILGTYKADTGAILDELGNVKSTDFGAKPGEFNLLNTPDELYVTPEQFWKDYNQPWLDNVIQRGDKVIIATDPIPENLYRVNWDTGLEELTGFGREFFYLQDNGFVYDSVTKQMIKQ